MTKFKWPIASIGLVLSMSGFPIEGNEKASQKNIKVEQAKDQTHLKAMKDSDIKQRQYMIEISRQLGVTCTFCHDLTDFKKTQKSAYKISKTHLNMVQLLNEKYSGQIGDKVDCYMCHRGHSKPDYKEKLGLTHE